MKIVITEFMDERAVDQLRAKHEVDYDPALVDDPARLAERATSADALIVRNRTQVRDQLLAALARCKVVGRLGVGLDNIDVAGCEARGLRVIPATGANALSVAEYVVTSAMLLLRGAYASTAAVVQGRWPRAALSSGREVAGKTLGLIGFGSIGRLTAQLAKGLGLATTKAGVEVDRNYRTSVDKLYVIGRSTQIQRSQAIISAGDGAAAALDILSTEKGKDFLDYDTVD